MPDIHLNVEMKDEDAVMKLVHEQRKSRGVLIYARKPLYESLGLCEEITTVNYNTSDDLLQHLDRKE